MWKLFKKIFWWGLILGSLFGISLRLWTVAKAHGKIYEGAAEIPLPLLEAQKRIAIIFGAGVWSDGEPSAALQDRITVGADLYKLGRVKKLILTGDNRTGSYNEPAAMKKATLKLGIPEDALVLDYAGRRTYDSCFRAKEIFGVQHAILVTQAFHLDRSLYLCNALGVDSIGVKADLRDYGRVYNRWILRDFLATIAAWVDIHIKHPQPILGKKIPIDALPETKP